MTDNPISNGKALGLISLLVSFIICMIVPFLMGPNLDTDVLTGFLLGLGALFFAFIGFYELKND